MPGPSFVPAQLVEAEGRSWRNFYPRQVRGLAWGAAGGALGSLVWGIGSPVGFLAAAALALPGFAYGFYMPAGRPMEWWLRVIWRFYTTPQAATSWRNPGARSRSRRRRRPGAGSRPRKERGARA